MNEIRTFPFELPEGFCHKLGYSGDRRFVALWWDFRDDSLICDDGANKHSGLDNWFWLDFFDALGVCQWLMDSDFCLGDGDSPATHILLIDRTSGEAYIGSMKVAAKVVARQQLA